MYIHLILLQAPLQPCQEIMLLLHVVHLEASSFILCFFLYKNFKEWSALIILL